MIKQSLSACKRRPCRKLRTDEGRHYVQALDSAGLIRRLGVLFITLFVGAFAGYGQVIISEFMASNDSTLADLDGDFSDWIELYNPSTNTVNLLDWALTDTKSNPIKWQFPATNLPPQSYLVVFASSKNRRIPGAELHTNFKLNANPPEYLALVQPDGTIASEFSPTYPSQFMDVSYGVASPTFWASPVKPGTLGRILVPTNGSLGMSWVQPGFDDSSWLTASNAIGFETGQSEFGPGYAGEILSSRPAGYWRLEEYATPILAVSNSGTLGRPGDGKYFNEPVFGQIGAIAGDSNRCAAFDGNNLQKIDVPYHASLNAPVFSIECWVRIQGGEGYRCVVASRTTGPSRGYSLYVGDSGRWEFWTGGGVENSWDILSGPYAVGNTWTHIVAAYNGSTKVIYTNGVLAASRTASYLPNPILPTRIGAGATETAGDYFFTGDIDEVAVYTNALAAARVLAHFQAGTNRLGQYQSQVLADNPSGFWRLNDQPTPVLANSGSLGSLGRGALFDMKLDQPGALNGDTNSACLFDADRSSKIEIPYAPQLNTRLFSVECWAKPVSGSGNYRAVLSSSLLSGGVTRGYVIYAMADDTWEFRLGNGLNSSWNSLNIGALAPNQWTYLAGTFDGSTLRFYTNGVLAGSKVTSYATNTSAMLRLGASENGTFGDYFFPGLLDEVAVYSNTLSSTRILAHYTAATNAAGGYSSAVQVDQPVGYWRMGDKPLVSPPAALCAGGLGTNANGFYSNSPVFGVTGAIRSETNKSVRFNGGEKVEVPYQPALNPAFFTVECWARCTGRPDTVRGVVSSRDSAVEHGYELRIGWDNRWQFWTGIEGGADALYGPWVVQGQWVHLVGVWNGAQKFFYVNGTLAESRTTTFNPNTIRPFRIGSGRGELVDGDDFFAGDVDEVAVYDHPLSPEEIERHYRVGTNAITTAIYYYGGRIQTDISGLMLGKNNSVYWRIPFALTNLPAVRHCLLKMNYDDGFAAFLNGVQVAGGNMPLSLDWQSAASALSTPAETLQVEEFDLKDYIGLLREGTNVLAVQGLNYALTNTDLLIQPELSIGWAGEFAGFMTTPTPGSPNGNGQLNLGPTITDNAFAPARVTSSNNIQVICTVSKTFAQVAEVALHWRIMFGPTNQVVMYDDGQHGDALAGDGIYGAEIPCNTFVPGQLVRWYVTATDILGNSSRRPIFNDPLNTPEYYGVMVVDNLEPASLPVWRWFAEDPSASYTRTGTRGVVVFGGEFYDNVFIRQRGGATTFGQKFDFNTGFHCKINDVIGRVEEVNLNGPGQDPSYMRPPVAFELFRNSGALAPQCLQMALYVNGSFDRVANFVEQVDSRFLERNGRDPEGALYKFVQRWDGSPAFYDAYDGVRKCTRKNEDTSDLQAVVDALLLTNNVEARQTFLFDNLDLPAIVNYLACRACVRDVDDVRKNFYFYRNNSGNREWSLIPWDKDLTLGNDADAGIYAGHPLLGDYPHRKPNADQYNLLLEAMFNDPRTRQMYLRRLRSVMDQQLAPENYLESRADAWLAPSYVWLGDYVSNCVTSLKMDMATLRDELFVKYAATNTAAGADALVPQSQTANLHVAFGTIDFCPVSGNQLEEFVQIINTNNVAIDITGWTVDGGIRYDFAPGTVLPPGEAIYLVRDANAFRARAASPRGGEKLFVQGNYSGELSAFGETLVIRDAGGAVAGSVTYSGDPSVVQQYLRISEIMYHPGQGGSYLQEEYQYIELVNISGEMTLDLNGVQMASGVSIVFTNSTLLGPGQRLVLVKNPVAFQERYGPSAPIGGVFSGNLANQGERLMLLDSRGEDVLDFTWSNAWQPLTDGFGFSLVAVDLHAPVTAWNSNVNWRCSSVIGGAPGQSDPVLPAIPAVRINELAASVGGDGSSRVELFNPEPFPADISGWLLSDDLYFPGKYMFPQGTVIAPGGYLVVTEDQFNPNGFGFAFQQHGGAVFVFATDNGSLAPYCHGFSFGASSPGVSFGRYVASHGREAFVRQANNTFGSLNAGPKTGPVVISEIMYHPAAIEDNLEFIEVMNISSNGIVLADANMNWRLNGGVHWDFQPGTLLQPGERVVVAGFDPTNIVLLEAFRSCYGISSSVRVFGPWSGRLNNDGETVSLKKSEVIGGNSYYVVMDEVDYLPDSPWPTNANGFGDSIQRKRVTQYANDPANWFASAATPGGISPSSPPDILFCSASGTNNVGTVVDLGAVILSPAPAFYQWLKSGIPISGATNSTLRLVNIQTVDAAGYVLVVTNIFGGATSSPIVLTVNQLPVAAADTVAAAKNQAIHIPLMRLLTASRDPDGDSLFVAGVDSTSTNGAAVTLESDFIVYQPAVNFVGVDQFVWRLGDNRGGISSARITVNILPLASLPFSMNTPPLLTSGGVFEGNWTGLAGCRYSVHVATNIGGPWFYWTNLSANASGLIQLRDTPSSTAPAYYYHITQP